MAFNNPEDIVAVIVLYKMSLEESSTFITLTKSLKSIGAKLDLFVYDNSPSAQELDHSKYKQWTISYVHDKNNPGVSTAYNRACDYAVEQGKKWLLLLDQDSIFPPDAIMRYAESISSVVAPLVVPRLVSSTGRVASPARYALHRGSHIRRSDLPPGVNDLRRRSFLNSGILVAVEAFKAVGGFDTELFYYSDHDFFFRFGKHYNKYFLLDIDVIHDACSAEIGRERFDLLQTAMLHMSKIHKTLWPHIWLFCRALKLTILTRNPYYVYQTIKKMAGAAK